MKELSSAYTFDGVCQEIFGHLGRGCGFRIKMNEQKSQREKNKRRWCWFDLDYDIGVHVWEQSENGEILIGVLDGSQAIGRTSGDSWFYIESLVRRLREKALREEVEEKEEANALFIYWLGDMSIELTEKERQLEEARENVTKFLEKELATIREKMSGLSKQIEMYKNNRELKNNATDVYSWLGKLKGRIENAIYGEGFDLIKIFDPQPPKETPYE